MESMLSERGKKLLIVENYTFRKDRETALGVSYRCTKRRCPAFISVDKSEEVLLKRKGNHNHALGDNLYVKKLQNGIKRKAAEDISQRPSTIINTGLKEASAEVNITTRDLDNIRKSVYRSRRSVLPVIPRSIEDVQGVLEASAIETNKDEEFVLESEGVIKEEAQYVETKNESILENCDYCHYQTFNDESTSDVFNDKKPWAEGEETFPRTSKNDIQDDSEKITSNWDQRNDNVYGDSEFDYFGKTIACQLKKLPERLALESMAFIQSYMVEQRLKAISYSETQYSNPEQCKNFN